MQTIWYCQQFRAPRLSGHPRQTPPAWNVRHITVHHSTSRFHEVLNEELEAKCPNPRRIHDVGR